MPSCSHKINPQTGEPQTANPLRNKGAQGIGHFTVVYLVAKPLIWSEAEGDLVVIETSI